MNSDSPLSPRDQLEARLTALLLGELSAEEAASVRQAIAQDAELVRLHDRLKQTIDLVRETVSAPEQETAAVADPLKLSSERREKLLATFKVVRPKELKRPRWPKVNWGNVKWREYAALAAMVAGLLAVAAVLLAPTLKSFKQMEAVGEADSEGLFALFDRRKGRAQRVQNIGGTGPGAVSTDREAAPVALSVEQYRGTVGDGFYLKNPKPQEPTSFGAVPVASANPPAPFTAALFSDSSVSDRKGLGSPMPAGSVDISTSPAKPMLADNFTTPTPQPSADGRAVRFSLSTDNRAKLNAGAGVPPQNAPVTAGVPIALPPVLSPEPSPQAGQVSDHGRHFATIALPTVDDDQPADREVKAARERALVTTEAALSQSDFSTVNRGGAGGGGAGVGGGSPGSEARSKSAGYAGASVAASNARGGGQGGGAARAPLSGKVLLGGEMIPQEPANVTVARANGSSSPAQVDYFTSGVDLNRNARFDAGLAAGDVGGLRYRTAPPALSTPVPATAGPADPVPVVVGEIDSTLRFENTGKVGDGLAMQPAGQRPAVIPLDEGAVSAVNGTEVARPALPPTSLASVAAPPPPPVVAATPVPAIEDQVQVQLANDAWIVRNTNSFASAGFAASDQPRDFDFGFKPNDVLTPGTFIPAAKKTDPSSQNEWFGTALERSGRTTANVSDDFDILLTHPAGQPAQPQAPQGSPPDRPNRIVSRAANGSEPAAGEPIDGRGWMALDGTKSQSAKADAKSGTPTADGGAQGVYSVNAVGFGNLRLANGKEMAQAGQVLDESHKQSGVDALAAKVDTDGDAAKADYRWRTISKRELADLSPTIEHFDTQAAGQSASKSQRESGRALGEKELTQLAWEEEAALSRKRVEIALPAGGRGDGEEKQRVAVGPVVVSEIMSQSSVDPATGLPVAGQQSEFVELHDQSAQIPQRVTRPLAARVAQEGKRQFEITGENVSDSKATSDEKLAKLEQELKQSLAVRDRLHQRVWQEKVDYNMPKNTIVEAIDKAEAGQTENKSLWGRISGVFGGEVERSARISVEKDAANLDTNGLRSDGGFDPYWAQTQAEKIQSKAVLEKAVEKLNANEGWASKAGGDKRAKEQAIQLLKKKLDVRQDPKSSLLDIRAKGNDAEEAARIANAVAEAYNESRAERWKQLSMGGLAALEKELVEQEKKIAEVGQKLEGAKKELKQGQEDAPLPKLAAGAPVPQPEVATVENAFSTFSLNVSDVSFKLAAASLEKGQMPDVATVRSEEFINAFDYRDPEPKGSAPIAFAWERARYPFAHDRDLLRFSVKTAASGRQPGRPLNLVLLLDNSGSMERADRVRIREACLRVLAQQLRPQDRVSLIAFARTSRLVVDGIDGGQAAQLPQWGGGLAPDGGTNLEEAMNLAYQTALRHFLANGVNRVVLLTDGAANLGDVEPESLKKKVEAHRKQGVALDCFGIGWDGLNDELLEALSRNGDGRYGFVNTPEAAQSEFVSQLAGALKVAASDVKVQVEWNPRRVTAYRQIGYAKHQLKKEQFRDNTVDAAEIGAAEAGNALYAVQVNPRGEGPLGTVRVRFKVPGTSDYREHEWPLTYEGSAKSLDQSSPALRLAANASAFSEWLVSSPFAAEVTPDKLLGYLGGVPETWPADPRPKKLEWMIRQAKSVSGK